MWAKIWLSTAIVIGITACATRYQPNGFTGGYDELQLSGDTYRVTAKGNGYTSNERAKRIALLRAADLTVEHGYDKFIVLDGESAVSTSSTPMLFNRIGRTVVATGGESISRPETSVTFKMLKKGAPGYDGALDAKLIAAQLRPQLT